MITRHDSRFIFTNDNDLYSDWFDKHGVKFIKHYNTPTLNYPTPEQISKLLLVGHVWRLGDRYYKLAHQYYSNSQLWWVIAWFNRKPTDAHNQLGDTIYIPMPLEKILSYLDV